MKKREYFLIVIFMPILVLAVLGLFSCQSQLPVLSSPSKLQIIDGNILTWNTVLNASGYSVQIDNNAPIDNSDLTSYSLVALREIGTYSIKVKAVGDGINYGDSDWSRIKEYIIKITEGLEYSLINDTEYEVSMGTAMDSIIVIPSTYEGKTVTKIAKEGFSNRFYETIDIIIPSSIMSIGDNAFENCHGWANVILPNSLTNIGNNAFRYWRELTSVILPNSLTNIGNEAFSGCYSLMDITLPNSLVAIGDKAFLDCSLTNITLPSSLTSIGDLAFANFGLTNIIVASGNTIYNSDGNCLIKIATKTLILGCKKSVIPSYVTSIESYAFWNCIGLTDIAIPPGVTSIGDYAFLGCSGLQKIIIPSSVISISKGTFSGCSGLMDITIPSSVTNIGYSAFSDCIKLASITIPSSVTSIGGSAFMNTCIWNNAINNNVVYADKWVIGYKGSLDSGYLSLKPDTLGIGDYAFFGRSELENITIPLNVTNIGDYAFWGCSGLKKIIIPLSVKYIGDSAFSFCSSLKTVFYGGADSMAWNTITIGNLNTSLTDAIRYYYSENYQAGNYWHYNDDGMPLKWN